MTTTGARRLRELSFSRRRAWNSTAKYAAEIAGTISGSFSNDSPRETLSDWERMDYGDDGDLDETGER